MFVMQPTELAAYGEWRRSTRTAALFFIFQFTLDMTENATKTKKIIINFVITVKHGYSIVQKSYVKIFFSPLTICEPCFAF